MRTRSWIAVLLLAACGAADPQPRSAALASGPIKLPQCFGLPSSIAGPQLASMVTRILSGANGHSYSFNGSCPNIADYNFTDDRANPWAMAIAPNPAGVGPQFPRIRTFTQPDYTGHLGMVGFGGADAGI